MGYVCYRTDEGRVGAQPARKKCAMIRTTSQPNNETKHASACSRINLDARGLMRIKRILGSPASMNRT